MKNNSYALIKSILFIEMVVILYLYIYGKNGLSFIQEQKQALKILNNQVGELKTQIKQLEEALDEWSSNDFYKEKIARENLHMARKDDKLFYIR